MEVKKREILVSIIIALISIMNWNFLLEKSAIVKMQEERAIKKLSRLKNQKFSGIV